MRSATRRALALAAAAGLGLAACSSPETSATDPTDTLEVTTWWTSASEAPAFAVFTDHFAAANPGVTLKNAAIAGGAGSAARVDLAKRLLAGNPPDVWQTFDGAATAAFVRNGQIRDLGTVFDSTGLRENLQPDILAALTVNGKPYAVPTGAHRGNVLFFNKAVLSKAGVAVPAPGYSRDSFLADLSKVAASGTPGLCLGGKDAFTTAELFENVLLDQVGAEGWRAIRDDRFDWGGAQATQALQRLDRILGSADAGAGDQSWDEAAAKLVDGGCGFLTMNDSAYGELVADGGTEATIGEVPYPGTDGAYLAVVDVFVASRTAPNAKNALAFLASLTDPAANLEFNKLKGSVPVQRNVDAASLSAYQQSASKALWANPVLPSITHGSAMNPAFTQGFFDAVDAYVRTRNVNSFAQALSEAVNPLRPAGR